MDVSSQISSLLSNLSSLVSALDALPSEEREMLLGSLPVEDYFLLMSLIKEYRFCHG